ncbi:uncharacterized protein I206_101116 [Kwoniella pini CBS 10737]|uniref:Uncharacterized protein n=1 Tax=Kwoniella pini CBS 10737 TaxID=1296096 RepID=A0A1B9IBE4_9TREE|nr:uncharacterized protein I206_00210 [Kwoniella pini CBS 10737]OCF52909.1 hypothetical protein I206_00210 [Kwoniella pini CBS 10737]
MGPNRYPELGRTATTFTSHPTIPLNEELPFLPPLPDTPQHANKSYSKKWDVEIDYPVLTTRQAVFNTPSAINRIPSSDLLKTNGTSSQSKYKENTPSPDILRTVVQPSKAPSATPHPHDLILKTTKVPCDIDSPFTKHTDSGSSGSAIKVFTTELPQPRLSASFNFGSYVADHSLLADQSLMASSSADEDSFHLDTNTVRQKPHLSEETNPLSCSISSQTQKGTSAPEQTFLSIPPNALDQSTLLPRSPAKTAHLLDPKNAINNVKPPWQDESEIFETCIDISVSSREPSLSPERTTSSSPAKSTMSIPHSQNTKGFPTSFSSHSLVSIPKIKRTFPASSSAQSLASLGEEAEGNEIAGDISTLLPVSPMKTAHLLTDPELITNEYLNMEEEKSFRLPLPSRATPFKPSFMSKTPRKSPPARMSPIKAIVQGIHSHNVAGLEAGDVTFDVKDLLARVNKPKRASGTEESFVDLLHDDLMFDGLDTSMMGPDESILPPSLRPRSIRGRPTSPIKPNPNTSPVRMARPIEPATIKRHQSNQGSTQQRDLPSSTSTHDLVDRHNQEERQESKLATISRSKSLSRVAEIVERVKSERNVRAQPDRVTNEKGQQEFNVPLSPPKTALRARTYTTARTPTLESGSTSSKPRNSIMPPSATSRRISLSAGSLPLAGTASHKAMQLPTSQSTMADPLPPVTGRRLISARTAATTGSNTSRLTGAAPVTAQPALRAARTSMAPPPPPSLALTSNEMKSKARFGSASNSISTSTSASESTVTSRSTVNRASRPSTVSSNIPSSRVPPTTASSARPPVSTASRISRPSIIGRPVGLPKPGDGLSGRSATSTTSAIRPDGRAKLSRGFGTDASGTTNRVVPRPSIAVSGKVSTGQTLSAMKSRSLSTPASSTITTKVPLLPTLPRNVKPITTREAMAKKSSLPPSSVIQTQRTRVGSTNATTLIGSGGLPRPSIRSTGSSKSSAPPGNSGSLTALRERLDKLHAKQGR